MISPICALVVHCRHRTVWPCGLCVRRRREQGTDHHAAAQWTRGCAIDRWCDETFGPLRCFSSETQGERTHSPSPARGKETQEPRGFTGDDAHSIQHVPLLRCIDNCFNRVTRGRFRRRMRARIFRVVCCRSVQDRGRPWESCSNTRSRPRIGLQPRHHGHLVVYRRDRCTRMLVLSYRKVPSSPGASTRARSTGTSHPFPRRPPFTARIRVPPMAIAA